MISVGIDAAKDKHGYFIINSEGVILADVFTIPNNMEETAPSGRASPIGNQAATMTVSIKRPCAG